MKSSEAGKIAENMVAKHFQTDGYKLLAQNWRTRWCEIDIIAKRSSIVYFIEVKYRSSTAWGDGVAAITDKKLRQMTFAAEFWVAENNYKGDYRLLVVSASASPPKIDEIIEL